MSVVVKGMEMPENCRECRFQDFGSTTGDTWCGVKDIVLAKNFEVIGFDGKPDWCPLIALPDKHGRLVEFVDVDEYPDDDTGTMEVCVGDVFKAYLDMKNAPTIVEAEGENADHE